MWSGLHIPKVVNEGLPQFSDYVMQMKQTGNMTDALDDGCT